MSGDSGTTAKGQGVAQDYWVKYYREKHFPDSTNPQVQVGRSINKVPITEERWQFTLAYLESLMRLDAKDRLLDLCAGNGLIAMPFAQKCQQVVAVDVSGDLLGQIDTQACPNIKTMVQDVRAVDFPPNSFTKIIFYFAFQLFNECEAVALFEKASRWLEDDGLFLVGDVPDQERIWAYFNTEEREAALFESLKNCTPILGTWYTKEFLRKMGKHTGFREARILDQPSELINAHYRFDILLRK